MSEKKEDWQEDYDPDQGSTAICPKCKSDDEVWSEDNGRWMQTRWVCENCGHKGEWT